MAYYRRRYNKRSKRNYPRRKRVYKRYFRRKTRGVTNKIYSFKRTTESTTVSVASGAALSVIYSPSLSNLPSYTDFTNLFDMYRICGMKIVLTPNINMNNVVTNQRFNVFSVIDYNDLGAVTVAQAEQYQNVKRYINTRTMSRYFKPRIAINQTDVSSTAFTASYKTPWISTSNVNIAHGFLKFISDVNPLANTYYWTSQITLYVQFKNVN